jgi:hypothetical protein
LAGASPRDGAPAKVLASLTSVDLRGSYCSRIGTAVNAITPNEFPAGVQKAKAVLSHWPTFELGSPVAIRNIL